MKIIFFMLMLSGLAGCASTPTPRDKAAHRAEPVMTALKAYHHDMGAYPQQLEELRPRYIGASVPFGDRSKAPEYWALGYTRGDHDNYQLSYDCSPCSQAVFKNGKFIWDGGPVFTK